MTHSTTVHRVAAVIINATFALRRTRRADTERSVDRSRGHHGTLDHAQGGRIRIAVRLHPCDRDAGRKGGGHLLFGGTVNGDNETLSLFEAKDDARKLYQLRAPMTLHDPRIEQAWRLNDRDILLVISEVDPADTRPDRPHRPKVHRLQR